MRFQTIPFPGTGQNVSSGAQPSRAQFPRTARLRKHAEFEQVYQNGRRHFSAHMTVFFLPRPAGAGPRVGLTVGRGLGGAVERNRIRRRVREAVRLQLRGLEAPVDIVINPRKSALNAEFAELVGEIARAFEKIQASIAGGQSLGKHSSLRSE